MDEKKLKDKEEKKRRKNNTINIQETVSVESGKEDAVPCDSLEYAAEDIEESEVLPQLVSPESVMKCGARELIDSIDDDDDSESDDDGELSDDEEEDAGGGIFTTRKKLYTDERLRDIVTLCREYCELGLRGTDMSHAELSAAKINFARQFFIAGQLEKAFQDGKNDIEELMMWDSAIDGYSSPTSWSLSFVYDFLKKGVQDLCTLPFRNIVINGHGQKFIEKMPDMLWLMSHYKRLKVSRSYLILLAAFDHYRISRPDILHFYMSNACSFNDLFIELFNSMVNRALPSNMTITTSDITNASARVVIKHNMIKASRNVHKLRVTSSSNGQGETRTEENKCNAITSRAEADRIRGWLICHLKRLKSLDTPPSPMTEGIERWKNMNTIKGMLDRGRNITNEKVIPEYEKYLKKMKEEQRKSGEAEYMSKFKKVLMKIEMTIPFLLVAIAAKGELVKPQKKGSIPTMKDLCVEKILHHYETYKEFKKFVISIDLNRANMKTLLKAYEKEIKNPVINTNDESN